MGIPIPKTLVILAYPSHVTLAIWVRVTGDAHITCFGNGDAQNEEMPISPYHRHIGRRLGTRLLCLQARYRKAVKGTTILSKWKGTFRSNQPKVVPNISFGRNLNGKRPFLWAQDLSKRHIWLVKKAPVQLGIHWVRSLRWEPRTRLPALLRRRY